MKYTQSKKGLFSSYTVEIDLQETGFDYKFKNKVVLGKPEVTELFYPYTDVSNQKTYTRAVSPTVKNYFIYAGIIFMILYFIAIFSIFSSDFNTPSAIKNSYEPLLFWFPLLLWFGLYKILGNPKVVIVKNVTNFFTLLDDPQTNEILENIYKKRNSYIRKKFIDDKNTKKVLSLESLELIKSMGIIDKKEFTEIKNQNEKENKNVGFTDNTK